VDIHPSIHGCAMTDIPHRMSEYSARGLCVRARVCSSAVRASFATTTTTTTTTMTDVDSEFSEYDSGSDFYDSENSPTPVKGKVRATTTTTTTTTTTRGCRVCRFSFPSMAMAMRWRRDVGLTRG